MRKFAFRGATRVIATIEILLSVLRLAVVGTAFVVSVYIMNNREAKKIYNENLLGLWIYCLVYGPEAILQCTLAATRLLRSTSTNIDPDKALPLAHFWRQVTTLSLVIWIIPFIFMTVFFLSLLPLYIPPLLAISLNVKGLCLYIVRRRFIPELETASELNDREEYLRSPDASTLLFQLKGKGET